MTENKNKLAVYAICKNESQFVDKWLDSMKEADYICVLDTGSTDDTYQKLCDRKTSYSNLIVSQKIITPWRFDVARNESLKLVPEDVNILLCTDLDEVLEPGYGDLLRNNWIEGKHERAEYMYTWSHLAGGTPGRIFKYNKVHNKNWKWYAPVHEYLARVEDKSIRNYSTDTTLILTNEPIKMMLHHYPDITKSRANYIDLLKLRCEEDPDDYNGKVYLANEYMYKGFPKECIETYQSIKDDSEHFYPYERAAMYVAIAECYIHLEDYVNASAAIRQSLLLDNKAREPYLVAASLHLRLNENEIAIGYINAALKNCYRHYVYTERDTSWTYEPYDLLCLAKFYSGDKEGALVAAEQALKFAPEDTRLKNNVKVIRDSLEVK